MKTNAAALLSILLIAALASVICACAALAASDTVAPGGALTEPVTEVDPPAPGIVRADAIIEAGETGAAVTGARIEYAAALKADEVRARDFEAAGYRVTGLYLNDTGEPGQARAQGRYLFLKLESYGPPAQALLNVQGESRLTPLRLNIRQKRALPLKDGSYVETCAFTNTGQIYPLSDRFFAGMYINARDGTTLNYRLYVPPGWESGASSAGREKLPLVIFLHGELESGTDNLAPLLGSQGALCFAADAAQAENPCFVLAPQKDSRATHGWSQNVGAEEEPVYCASYLLNNLKNLVDELMGRYRIDGARLYAVGYGMGAGGALSLNMAYPDMLAATVCVDALDVYTDEQLLSIAQKPIWMLLSQQDESAGAQNMRDAAARLEALGALCARCEGERGFDGYLRGFEAEKQAREQIDAARAQNANLLFTQYLPGTAQPGLSHAAVFQNRALRLYLFDQALSAPYAPG